MPHVAIWPRGAYPGLWGVWACRADCRAGKEPAAMSWRFETLWRTMLELPR